MSESTRCPRDARRHILSTFEAACRAHLVQAGTFHPRAVDLVWRLAGGHLGKIKSCCERVVGQAAARGVPADFGLVASRWGAS